MSKKTTADDSKATVETVQKLIALAADESNEEEARNAAMKAVQLMKQNDLHVISGTDLSAAERVINEARAMAKTARADQHKNMAIGGVLGYLIARGKLF
jgi:hypothetical protein